MIYVCDETNLTLTCVTDTGILMWSTPFGEKTHLTSSAEVGFPVSFANSLVTTEVTSKSGLSLTSVAIINTTLLNGTTLNIKCADALNQENVTRTVLITPGINFIAIYFY